MAKNRMKKRTRIILLSIISILLVLGGFTFVKILMDSNRKFSANGRYDETHLNYMGVIFEDKTDLYDICFHCEGPPEYNFSYCDCDEENQLQYYAGDFFFKNKTQVIACAPGYVERISWLEGSDPAGINIYIINVGVRYNQSVWVTYCFEPFTNKTSDWELQGSWLNVSVGDWVQKGDPIGVFLEINEYAHIHWDIGVPCLETGQPMPEDFYDAEGYDEMVELISYLNTTHGASTPEEDRGGCYF